MVKENGVRFALRDRAGVVITSVVSVLTSPTSIWRLLFSGNRSKSCAMTNRTILITGCSSGIGLHCAKAMKRAGWHVLTTARRDADLEMLKSEGLEAAYLDYTKPESIAACADFALDRTNGHCFALFNNGAYGQGGAVEDLPVEALREQFEANFFGWHDLTRRLLPPMIDNGAGRIVQCSSVLGLVALKFRGAYNASKFALEGLSNTLRLELRGTGVYVSLIEPGPIVSKFGDNGFKVFKRTIDMDSSRFSARYRKRLQDHENGIDVDAKNAKWRLGPEAVFDSLVHAVECTRPKPHYFVTQPTYLMDFARRVLPNRLLDRLLDRVS